MCDDGEIYGVIIHCGSISHLVRLGHTAPLILWTAHIYLSACLYVYFVTPRPQFIALKLTRCLFTVNFHGIRWVCQSVVTLTLTVNVSFMVYFLKPYLYVTKLSM